MIGIVIVLQVVVLCVYFMLFIAKVIFCIFGALPFEKFMSSRTFRLFGTTAVRILSTNFNTIFSSYSIVFQVSSSHLLVHVFPCFCSRLFRQSNHFYYFVFLLNFDLLVR